MCQMYNKNSFERFGDDLTEELLSYLSFEEKFKYESVSKQWQRFIYNKQFSLYWTDSIKPLTNIEKEKTNRRGYHHIDYKKLCLPRINHILKKCQNIKFIDILIEDLINLSINPLIESIIKNCNKLNAIRMDFKDIEEESDEESNKESNDDSSATFKEEEYNQFFERFGKRLISINCTSLDTIRKSMKLCPNLKEVIFDDWYRLNGKDICLDNLKSFKINYYDNNDFNNFKELSSEEKNSIKMILITFCEWNYEEGDSNPLEDYRILFRDLSELKQLKHLQIIEQRYDALYDDHTHLAEFIPQLFKQYANELQNLESFTVEIPAIDMTSLVEVFNQYYTQLKQLSIKYTYGCDYDDYSDYTFITQSLSNCKKLTKLVIDNYNDCYKDEDFFNDIHKHLPNLQYICLGNAKINTNVFNSLSNLKRLQYLYLNSSGLNELDDLLQENIEDFKKKSTKLRIFSINGNFF